MIRILMLDLGDTSPMTMVCFHMSPTPSRR